VIMHEGFQKKFGSTGRSKVAWYGIVLVLTAASLFPVSRSRAADDSKLVSTTTREGRLVVFDDVWETIQERYYDLSFRGVNWSAKRSAFRPAAADATSTQEFYDVLRQMVGTLKDAHTRVYSPEEKFDWWNPRFVTVGLTIREIEGLPTVVFVEPGSAAARAGLRRGDVITSIDNVPAAKLSERRLQSLAIPPDDNSTRSRTIGSLLEGSAGTSVTLGWQGRDRKTQTTVLKRYWSQKHLGLRSQKTGSVAVIGIDVFTQSVAMDFLRSLPKMLNDAEAIVLDLRANGGGDAEAMAQVAAAFMGDGINLGRFVDRGHSYFDLQTNTQVLSPFASFTQTKLPLVVLTGESTSSAAEILAEALQTRHRARVIGSETCGCVLAIRSRHSLPDGGVLDVSEFDYRTVDGIRLEGLGVKPDEPVTITRADLYSNRDRALHSARAFLNRTASHHSIGTSKQ